MTYLSEKDFTRYKDLIYSEIGLIFTQDTKVVILSRIKARLAVLRMTSVNEYYELLLKDKAELSKFLDTVTTNLTMFFRSRSHEKIIIDVVIPEMIKSLETSVSKTITVWSAGCSSGEEAYTLGMILKRNLPRGFSFKIIGTDISNTSLEEAKTGIYGKDRIKNIPLEYLSYITPSGSDSHVVDDLIKRNVEFRYHNLVKDEPLKEIDIIVCFNVLIYFDQRSKDVVFDKFYNSLHKDSFLIMGFSDNVNNSKFFIPYRTDYGVIYKRT